MQSPILYKNDRASPALLIESETRIVMTDLNKENQSEDP